jgi:glycosyltransferase involved in cell wall biosynthesis
MANPLVSVVIPCFNHGKFLMDAVQSVELCDKELVELIIINDGSNDPYTIAVFEDLKKKGYNVIQQSNQGLAKARNNGIRLAKGKYILPLDADNKIRPVYITKGVEVLESNPEIAVVYGKSEYFGERQGTPEFTSSFNLQKLLLGNYIDACALFPKEIWNVLGGYDENMPYAGYEDWDFWIRIALKGKQFYFLDEVVFDYRYLHTSMSRSLSEKKSRAMKDYVQKKHHLYMSPDSIEQFYRSRFRLHPLLFIGKFLLLGYFPKYYKKLLQKGTINRL